MPEIIKIGQFQAAIQKIKVARFIDHSVEVNTVFE